MLEDHVPANLDLASSPVLNSRLAEAGDRVTRIITYISLPASLRSEKRPL